VTIKETMQDLKRKLGIDNRELGEKLGRCMNSGSRYVSDKKTRLDPSVEVLAIVAQLGGYDYKELLAQKALEQAERKKARAAAATKIVQVKPQTSQPVISFKAKKEEAEVKDKLIRELIDEVKPQRAMRDVDHQQARASKRVRGKKA
jgi:transcriptional regulator with XRE-family HTH domain